MEVNLLALILQRKTNQSLVLSTTCLLSKEILNQIQKHKVRCLENEMHHLVLQKAETECQWDQEWLSHFVHRLQHHVNPQLLMNNNSSLLSIAGMLIF